MIRRPPRSTLFPTRRSSDLARVAGDVLDLAALQRVVACTAEDVRRKRLAMAWVSGVTDRKSTRLNSSHVEISYAVFCLKKKKKEHQDTTTTHTLSMRSASPN